MRYVVINGSPHKGNTWKLAEQLERYLQELDTDCTIEEIHLAKLGIPFCTGCSNCFRLGYEKCPHYSIISQIVKAMELSDGVIIVSTTYYMQGTALLKNLLDHLCFYTHRPHFFNNKAFVLTTTGGVGGMAAAKGISSMLYGIGFNRCYLFSQPTYSWNDYQPADKTKIQLRKRAEQFYMDIQSGKLHSPSWLLLIPYNLFRGMSLAYTKGNEFATKDGDHWADECRRKGVYDPLVPVQLYKRPFGHLFYFIGKFVGKQKRYQVTYRK